MRDDYREPLLGDALPISQPASRRPSRRAVLLVMAAAAAAALALCALLPDVAALMSAGLGRSAASHGARPPYCRKSASMVVLPGGSAAVWSGGQPEEASGGAQLLVWSGIGKHKHIFDDLFAFDLAGGAWRELHPQRGPRPISRWKAGNAQLVDGGLAVVGGDRYIPGTRRHSYSNDAWRLDPASLRWQRAAPAAGQPAMEAKRGHSTMLHWGDDGVPRVVTFGGRTRDKTLLNDVWEVALRFGAGHANATWHQLAPNQPAGEHAPTPRRGHSALYLPPEGGQNGQMLVWGGRMDEGPYYGDLWSFDLVARSWRRLEAQGEAPAARDHHAAALHGGEMVIFGGRAGRTYSEAQPMNDTWSLHLGTLRWRRVAEGGPAPIARFEHSYAQQGSSLFVFGGQTVSVCQLNDVWQLDLREMAWRQLAAPRWCTAACRRQFEDP